jgi:hypothetical protein
VSMSIAVTDRSGPHPWPIELVLRCDGCSSSSAAEFRHDQGYVGAYRLALRAGWKDTHRDGVRVFLGPCCSGKATS